MLSTRSCSAASQRAPQKKAAARAKKKRRSNNADGKNEAEEEGGDSAPASPFRGKAAWLQDGVGADKETEETQEQKRLELLKMKQLKQQQQQQLAMAVAAKIAHLEKEKTKEGVFLEGAGVAAPNQSAPDTQAQQQALVTSSGGATEAARTRAAVTNALYSGADPASIAAKELLLSAGGSGVLDGLPVAGLGGATAGAPARHINPRPLPQRNFKLKV